MSPDSYTKFMEGFNPADGTNSNYDTKPELWDWWAPKVTSRINGRFIYGMVETRVKAPKGYGGRAAPPVARHPSPFTLHPSPFTLTPTLIIGVQRRGGALLGDERVRADQRWR